MAWREGRGSSRPASGSSSHRARGFEHPRTVRPWALLSPLCASVSPRGPWGELPELPLGRVERPPRLGERPRCRPLPASPRAGPEGSRTRASTQALPPHPCPAATFAFSDPLHWGHSHTSSSSLGGPQGPWRHRFLEAAVGGHRTINLSRGLKTYGLRTQRTDPATRQGDTSRTHPPLGHSWGEPEGDDCDFGPRAGRTHPLAQHYLTPAAPAGLPVGGHAPHSPSVVVPAHPFVSPSRVSAAPQATCKYSPSTPTDHAAGVWREEATEPGVSHAPLINSC